MVESNRVSGKCRIRMSIEKVCRRVREKGRMSVSTEKWKNPGEYREKIESVRVPGNGRICASIEKTVLTSTGKRYNECENRKMGKSSRVPGKGTICASIEKVCRRVPKKSRISVSTEKMVESVQVSKKFPGDYKTRLESM